MAGRYFALSAGGDRILGLIQPHGPAAYIQPVVEPANRSLERRTTVAIYTWPKCGMSVGTMTCGTCGKELVHDTLQLDGGASVDVAKCPDGHGKIKSPQCCGEDMGCSV